MSLITEKSLKVITFSRKQEDWYFWEVKFLAKVRCKRFREILLGTIAILMDAKKFDVNKVDEKEKHKICEKIF